MHYRTQKKTPYINTTSGLTATDVQDAIDELAEPTFSEASTRANIASGESIATLFGKIKKFFTDLKTVAFSGSYNDLSGTGGTNLNMTYDSSISDMDDCPAGFFSGTFNTHTPSGNEESLFVLSLKMDNNSDYCKQIAWSLSDSTKIYTRQCHAGSWGAWTVLIDGNNISSQTVANSDMVDGLHAYLMMTLNASGQPHGASYPMIVQHNRYADNDNRFKAVVVDGTTFADTHEVKVDSSVAIDTPRVVKDINTVDANVTRHTTIEEVASTGSGSVGLPEDHYFYIISFKGADGNYGSQLAIGETCNNVWVRNYMYGTSWSAWKQLIDSSNIASQSVSHASAAATIDGFSGFQNYDDGADKNYFLGFDGGGNPVRAVPRGNMTVGYAANWNRFHYATYGVTTDADGYWYANFGSGSDNIRVLSAAPQDSNTPGLMIIPSWNRSSPPFSFKFRFIYSSNGAAVANRTFNLDVCYVHLN